MNDIKDIKSLENEIEILKHAYETFAVEGQALFVGVCALVKIARITSNMYKLFSTSVNLNERGAK